MKNLARIVVLLLVSSCSTTSESGQNNQPVANAAASISLPRSYWPPDSTTQKAQIVVPGPVRYTVRIVTKCLNDSAVINRVLLDDGPVLDVSHNYESEISIARQGQKWQQVRLTKEIFRQNSAIQKLGPLMTLYLSRTKFLRYKAPDFYFTTRIGVPDSDIFDEAEVIFIPSVGFHVINVQENAGTN